jgi:hypothetical protein
MWPVSTIVKNSSTIDFFASFIFVGKLDVALLRRCTAPAQVPDSR